MEYIEINPIDKIPELKALLSGQNIELKTSSNEGYTWLEDYSVCVVVYNPFNENTLEIELEEQTQFSLFLRVIIAITLPTMWIISTCVMIFWLSSKTGFVPQQFFMVKIIGWVRVCWIRRMLMLLIRKILSLC